MIWTITMENVQELVSNSNANHNNSIRRNSSESSEVPVRCEFRRAADNLHDSSSDEEAPRKRTLKRVKRFSDSDDSDISTEKVQNGEMFVSENTSQAGKSVLQSSDSEIDTNIFKSLPPKQRIQIKNISDSEESDTEGSLKKDHIHDKRKKSNLQDNIESQEPTSSNSDYEEKQRSDNASDNAVKNEEQQLRMKNKRNKMRDRFKNLIKTRKEPLHMKNNKVNETSNKGSSSESGEEDIASIEKIKQNIKERMSFKPSICDPDTSDEESNQQRSVYKQKKERKTKLTSPKPQRMSAKQAMENMQKIKSESNRMLREKEVSLPYHRPKALSLKDIMSRRKLAVSSDGKALPIKMNEEQLKQYAHMLEERQKEMMELCKSESEEEQVNENPAETIKCTTEEPEVVTYTHGNIQHLESDAVNIGEAVRCTAESSKVLNAHLPEAVIKNITENESNEVSVAESNGTKNADECITLTDLQNQSNSNSKQIDLISSEKSEINMSANTEETIDEQDSETGMKLVYNDSANSSIEENFTTDIENQDNITKTQNGNTTLSKIAVEETIANDNHASETVLYGDSTKNNTERDSQLISLNLDTEGTKNSNIKDITDGSTKVNSVITSDIVKSVDSREKEVIENAHESGLNTDAQINIDGDENIHSNEASGGNEDMEVSNEFSDDDINMVDIDNIIENAEIIKDIEDRVNSQFLVRDKPLNLNPKITGAPGLIIDLDNSDTAPSKTGVELLKDRFIYFAKLKTPEEKERERGKILKPGTQLFKLKQDLQDKIDEQRSLEWAKRLEEVKEQEKERKELNGEESEEDDIDKIEAAIEEKEEIKEGSEDSDSGEEEPIENDIEIKDKPRIKNAMLDDEAEESECDDNKENKNDKAQNEDDDDNEDVNNDGVDDGVEGDDDDESESDESNESESEEEQTVTKKGRILKAFEDSDEEEACELKQDATESINVKGTSEGKSDSSIFGSIVASLIYSQDDELQSAQRAKSNSDDLFTSQESVLQTSEAKLQAKDSVESDETFTQTFSILDSTKPLTAELDLNSSGKTIAGDPTQFLDTINDVTLCPITDSQNLPIPSQIPTTQLSQSLPIGEDILALCTGQFYNNQFVSQVDNQVLGDAQNYDAFDNYQSQESQEEANTQTIIKTNTEKERRNDATNLKETGNFIVLNRTEKIVPELNKEDLIDPNETVNAKEMNDTSDKENKKNKVDDDNLKSILDELADSEFDSPKPNKFFAKSNMQRDRVHTEIQMKRKLVIDSDDETNEGDDKPKKAKKLKKKNPEKRALQISDDEEEESDIEEMEEYESDIEKDNADRLVEYDSEENEIEVKALNPKKKRKMAEFFENEAELTSEDEWAGSGDEDEAGLDRMEREAGDEDTFHQGQLQRELGQIHMRDVLDQDKREVRLIQELLFEDGDLGAGGRQRKFKWSNMGDEETGTVPDEFADTQEEEFESEEQWRKQRHEREMFLRQLQNKDEPQESLNVSLNRSTIIKANLSKTMSSVLMEVKSIEKTETTVEKKSARDIPSTKKPFALLQTSYQGSLLGRGRGALARLAALAAPLADDDARVGALGPSKGNFVFAAISPADKETKVLKRKADSKPSTPKLVKKIRTEENNTSKSLLDHFKL